MSVCVHVVVCLFVHVCVSSLYFGQRAQMTSLVSRERERVSEATQTESEASVGLLSPKQQAQPIPIERSIVVDQVSDHRLKKNK